VFDQEPRLDLRQLRYFLAVADELHFGRAAARLRIAQPALSRAIRKLETEVGAELFDRSSRRVTLTPAGEAFAAEARRALAHARAAVTGARRAQRVGSHVALGFVSSLARRIAPGFVADFAARRPTVAVDLYELPMSDQLVALKNGSLDLGLLYLPAGWTPHELAVAPLRHERVLLAVPAGHALADRDELDPREARDEDWVGVAPEAMPSPERDLLARAGFAPRVVVEASSMNALLALVAAGRGVAFAPEAAVDESRTDVAFVPLAPHVPPIVLAAAWDDEHAGDLHDDVLASARAAA
jgi:DNA-binding transcriptional LysR family regulator